MIDKRELINARMVELLGEVSGIIRVFRDRSALPPQESTPAIVYLDGVERKRTVTEGRNFTAMPAAVFSLKPQVFLVLTLRTDPDNTLLPDGTTLPVWQELSDFRVAIIDAVTNDDTLVALIGDNGSVTYEGYDSDMQTGSTMGVLGATMQFYFTINYVLDPSDLVN